MKVYEDFETKRNKEDEQKVLDTIKTNTTQFIKQILKQKNFGRYSCTCPFHHSHDGDFSFDKKTGMWRCWGKCDDIYSNSITVVACLYNDLTLKEYKNLDTQKRHYLYAKAFNFLKGWIETGDLVYSEILDRDENLEKAIAKVKKIDKSNTDEVLKAEFNLALASTNTQVKDYADKYFIKAHPNNAYPYLETYNLIYAKSNARLINEGRFNKEAIKEYGIYTYCDNENMPRFLRNFYFYPIYDENAVLVASQGRKFKHIKDSSRFSIPKMYNPKGFSKNKVLFGLTNVLKRYGNKFVFDSFCKSHLELLHPLKEITIHEGPADTVKAFEHGYLNSVSLMGKTISDEQISLLKKVLSPDGRVIVFLDADDPGLEASKVVVARLLEAGLTVYEGRMTTGEKDVGESTKENFFKSLGQIKKVSLSQ